MAASRVLIREVSRTAWNIERTASLHCGHNRARDAILTDRHSKGAIRNTRATRDTPVCRGYSHQLRHFLKRQSVLTSPPPAFGR
jgi:hypothetical protein